MPIDPSFAIGGASGPEWSIPPVDAPTKPPATGFGSLLADSVSSLEKAQTDAASAAQALATGQAPDVTSVVMAVERAQLTMQLASQVRTKGVEAIQSLMQTQV
jgi:flagellar hook-basal body complex protein FliE